MGEARLAVIVDSPFTAFVRTLPGAALIVLSAIALAGATLYWAGRGGRVDRRPVVIAGATGAAVAALLNVVLGGAGIWRSTDYTLPGPVLGSMVLLIAVGLAWVIAFYRWLVRRRARRLVFAALLCGMAGLIVVGDEQALAQGYIGFGGGYTVWMDALVGVGIFVVPVGTYELLRRSPRSKTRAAGS